MRFGVKGQADISGILHRTCRNCGELAHGVRVEIEVKGPEGRMEKSQKRFRAMIEKHGGIYVVARSIDDVRRALEGDEGA